MPLHVIQQPLGHADARTTSVYFNATRLGLHESMLRFERFRGEVCTDLLQDDPERRYNVAHENTDKVLNPEHLERGAGDGDRTRDQQLGKL